MEEKEEMMNIMLIEFKETFFDEKNLNKSWHIFERGFRIIPMYAGGLTPNNTRKTLIVFPKGIEIKEFTNKITKKLAEQLKND